MKETETKIMKAWLVREKDGEYATVVFAETRGKARAEAQATNACEDACFCDIEVTRKPNMDKYYKKGKREMDWYNAADRLALVKECGFYCVDMNIEECADCPARQYCDEYIDYFEEWMINHNLILDAPPEPPKMKGGE